MKQGAAVHAAQMPRQSDTVRSHDSEQAGGGGVEGTDRGQDPSSLIPSHHTDAGIGPHEQEVWAVGPPTHSIVAGTKAATYQHC